MSINGRTTAMLAIGILSAGVVATGQSLPSMFPYPNATGFAATYNEGNQPIDLTGPFFQSLGSNSRSCGSCHRPAQGWSISAAEVAARFDQTQGVDPIFSPNDGSNCDHNIDTSSLQGRRKAYSLLINRGLIRISMATPPPATSEFTVISVNNPYGCNDTATLALYRRPLPSTNLKYLSTVMWDGRESSPQTDTQKIAFSTYPNDLVADLGHQIQDATTLHAQGSVPLTPLQQQQVLKFEMALSTAQVFDYKAGALNSAGAMAGPQMLSSQTTPAFFVGINDPLGGNPHGTAFTSSIFSLFSAWATPKQNEADSRNYALQQARASIVRGETIFNTKAINIVGVAGLNDDLNLPVIPGFCGTCHDSPNVGNHSVAAPLNIGVGDLTSPLDVSYLPVISVQNKTTREIKTTTDPGRALVTGLWKDVGRMKGPVLRGLASRAPYFHNGSANSLSDVIQFYDKRFNIGFSEQEKRDLLAFLNTL